MGSRERMFLLVFGGILALVFGWAEETRGQPRETIEGAKKESEMVFYSGMVVQDTQVLLSAFEKKISVYQSRSLSSLRAAINCSDSK